MEVRSTISQFLTTVNYDKWRRELGHLIGLSVGAVCIGFVIWVAQITTTPNQIFALTLFLLIGTGLIYIFGTVSLTIFQVYFTEDVPDQIDIFFLFFLTLSLISLFGIVVYNTPLVIRQLTTGLYVLLCAIIALYNFNIITQDMIPDFTNFD